MTDGIDGIGGGDFSAGVGAISNPTGPAGAGVASAADAVSPGSISAQAEKVAGGDGYDKVAGLSGRTDQPQLKDGDFLNDPQKLTPGQAEGLEKLLDSPDVLDDAKDHIREFLKDYRDGRDRLLTPEEKIEKFRPPTYREEG